MLRVLKRSMRHPPRSITPAIIAFNQRHLLRRLPVFEVPLMFLVGPDTQRLTLSVRVNQTDGNEIRVRHGVRVSNSERVLEDPLDGTPDVDDLVAVGEEVVGFIGQVVGDTAAGCRVGLVDVHALNGATGVGGAIAVVGGAADCVAEDEDTGGPCAGGGVSVTGITRGQGSMNTHASFRSCSVSG